MQNTFVSVDQIITNNLDLLFGGMEIKSAHMFRTTRNADVARNEEEAEDLLEMITDEMRELRFAPFVRLEVDCEMPQDVIQRLSNELGLSNKDDVYTVCGQMALGG
jgi:polyphosphate kinase